MFPHHTYPCTGTVQHLGTQYPELTVAEHHDVRVRLHMDLFQNLKGGGQRLGEHCRFVGDAVRHRVEIGDWHAHILRETAIGVQDPHDLPGWAVAPKPLDTDRTAATGKVDLSHHTLAQQ